MSDTGKQEILEFLHKQKLAVISTVNSVNCRPESALIAFVEDEQLRLYFQTSKHTRKATNLKKNFHVALVIGLDINDFITVQYEGKAEQLTKRGDLELCKQRFVDKDSPTTEDYFNHPLAIFFKVTPTWISYSNYLGNHPEVIEIKTF